MFRLLMPLTNGKETDCSARFPENLRPEYYPTGGDFFEEHCLTLPVNPLPELRGEKKAKYAVPDIQKGEKRSYGKETEGNQVPALTALPCFDTPKTGCRIRQRLPASVAPAPGATSTSKEAWPTYQLTRKNRPASLMGGFCAPPSFPIGCMDKSRRSKTIRVQQGKKFPCLCGCTARRPRTKLETNVSFARNMLAAPAALARENSRGSRVLSDECSATYLRPYGRKKNTPKPTPRPAGASPERPPGGVQHRVLQAQHRGTGALRTRRPHLVAQPGQHAQCPARGRDGTPQDTPLPGDTGQRNEDLFLMKM